MPLITLDEFISTNTNRPLNWDGKYGNQCVDLFRFYVRDVLGAPQFPGVTGAIELLSNFTPSLFEMTKNSLLNVPQKGDIVIFKATKDNPFGHVSIFIEGNILSFKSFDQNFPSQGYKDKDGNFIGTGVCHIQSHSYINVAGWLRFKGAAMTTYKGYNLDDKDSMMVAVDVLVRLQQGDIIDQITSQKLLNQQADAFKERYDNEKRDMITSSCNTLSGILGLPQNGGNSDHLNSLLEEVKIRLTNSTNNGNNQNGNGSQNLPTMYNGKKITGYILEP